MPEDDLIACIARAQAEFGSLPKDSHAMIRSDKGSYEYDYISDGALMARVREVLSPMGVAVLVSCINRETRSGGSTYVTAQVTFAKGTERESVTGDGEGLDPRDKGYNKAITTAVRIALTKTFLQGGDIDPEQTINERTRDLPGTRQTSHALTDTQLKRLTQKAIDSGIVDEQGALDHVLLCRIASFVKGEKITRMDAIPPETFARLVDTYGNGKPPALDAFAASRETGMVAIIEKEMSNGW